MTLNEKSKLIIELINLRKSDQAYIESLMKKMDTMAENQLCINKYLNDLMFLLEDKENAYSDLLKKCDALLEELKVNRKMHFGSKSQKGISKKKSDKGGKFSRR